jgi:mRNA interferase RelE/StbE
MSYDVQWNEAAIKQLEKLEEEVAERIVKKVDSITDWPFHFLSHYEGEDVYKLRIGDYRALIDADRSEEVLRVQFIGHRRNVYKRYQNR